MSGRPFVCDTSAAEQLPWYFIRLGFQGLLQPWIVIQACPKCAGHSQDCTPFSNKLWAIYHKVILDFLLSQQI